MRIESRAKIVGPTEVYVKVGSTLSLTCLVSQAVENAAIFWYHDLSVVDDSPPSGQVNVELHFDAPSTSLTSRLRITNLQTVHSGNYTCLPTAADPASVIVHVINGKPTRFVPLYCPFIVIYLLCVIQSLSFEFNFISPFLFNCNNQIIR